MDMDLVVVASRSLWAGVGPAVVADYAATGERTGGHPWARRAMSRACLTPRDVNNQTRRLASGAAGNE